VYGQCRLILYGLFMLALLTAFVNFGDSLGISFFIFCFLYIHLQSIVSSSSLKSFFGMHFWLNYGEP
jgi:hypothetical protein